MRITEESMKQTNPELNGPGQMADVDAPAAKEPEVQLTEREKLKAMNTQDRFWYIWEYYKWHIISVVIAAFILFSLGKAAYMSTFTTAMHLVTINNRTSEETGMTAVTDDFHDWFGLDKKDRIISESLFIAYGDDTTEYSLANMAKISALAAARELDVIIGDTASIDHYAAVGAFQNLETALPPEILALVKDRLYYTENEAGIPYAFAIDISGTEFAENCLLYQEPPLFGLVSSSEKNEISLGLVEYIFQ